MKDYVLANFIEYMKLVLEHTKIDYLKQINKIKHYEKEFEDEQSIETKIDDSIYVQLDKLSPKEKQLIEMLYIKGFSYKEISLMTKETISALEKRRYRAIQKIRKDLED